MQTLFEGMEIDTMVKQPNKVAAPAASVLAVFMHWRNYHSRAFPTPHDGMKEWHRVAARLKEGYSIDDLCRAIDGMHKSDFHNGNNDRGTKYLSLELCMRDATRVERFLQIDEEHVPNAPILSEKTRRTVRAAQQWAQRRKQATNPRIEGHG